MSGHKTAVHGDGQAPTRTRRGWTGPLCWQPPTPPGSTRPVRPRRQRGYAVRGLLRGPFIIQPRRNACDCPSIHPASAHLRPCCKIISSRPSGDGWLHAAAVPSRPSVRPSISPSVQTHRDTAHAPARRFPRVSVFALAPLSLGTWRANGQTNERPNERAIERANQRACQLAGSGQFSCRSALLPCHVVSCVWLGQTAAAPEHAQNPQRSPRSIASPLISFAPVQQPPRRHHSINSHHLLWFVLSSRYRHSLPSEQRHRTVCSSASPALPSPAQDDTALCVDTCSANNPLAARALCTLSLQQIVAYERSRLKQHQPLCKSWCQASPSLFIAHLALHISPLSSISSVLARPRTNCRVASQSLQI
ncbi:hypothetical protein BC831DRAFT_220994 [Entophlyctis helioformis]|nr:hypothetical protein BC831DRAFT_220994 [Entophlyctis helioformis]